MEPLASRIRPRTLDEFVGQEHLVGTGKSPAGTRGPLREAIEHKHLMSFVLWGPPGSGKTTLARIYAHALDADFYELSAVEAGKEDIKRVLGTQRPGLRHSGEVGAGVEKRVNHGLAAPSALFETPAPTSRQPSQKPIILFIDEIHRFNKAQQDFLLPFVERGDLTLIGATTENPSFEVIPALLSRCRVFVLNELAALDIEQILSRAAKVRGAKLSQAAKKWLIDASAGDARQALSVLDAAAGLYGAITPETLSETVQSRHLRYDKSGEEHHNTISAFIKSMRAGQPDAALYYMARMVDAGEDPLFIARRMVVFASEDVGLAVPTALVVANAVFRACETIGYPECAINLAHGAAYLAECKKSRRSYDALRAAQEDVRKHGALPVPMKVRNAPTKLMKDLGYHKGYEMYSKESYLPKKLQGKKYLK